MPEPSTPLRRHLPLVGSGGVAVGPDAGATLDAVVTTAGSALFDGVDVRAERCDARPLPMTLPEVRARGWDALDVLFISGDAYVDHPSFANALLGRLLESAGFRVAILSQPEWRSAEAFRALGRPRLFFAVSAGNMDSMINHYTANKKVRNADAYSPGGEIGRRPDRATLAYCQRAREAFPGVPVVAGGVEASLRRLSHYDYWSDTVRRSILLDSKADLLAFGMGERTILEIAQRLARGDTLRSLRGLRGVAYRLGAREPRPEQAWELPSHERASSEPLAFCELTRVAHRETNPHNARTLLQAHGAEAVVVNPPALPLGTAEMDAVYGLPYTRRAHPSYGARAIPAYEVIKTSVQIMRGCFGGCTFCSITAHEGRAIQSRSEASVLAEVERMARDPDFTGTVSDLGGPTANMYRMRCTRPEVEAVCRRSSCVHPSICKLLDTSHAPLVRLLRRARGVPGVRKVLIASGIRMDLARRDPEYVRELARHHVGGHLKVAPEHVTPRVLGLMKKPSSEDFLAFSATFERESSSAGKEQYLVPYFIASHPGSDLDAMIELALFLKRHGYAPEQVQDFIPSPFDLAACMYHTGLDPLTLQPVSVARRARERGAQRALLQFFAPERYFEVRSALEEAGRTDLIGAGKGCLIPDTPPRRALDAQRARKGRQQRGPGDEAESAARSPAAPSRAGGRQRRARPGGAGGGYRPR